MVEPAPAETLEQLPLGHLPPLVERGAPPVPSAQFGGGAGAPYDPVEGRGVEEAPGPSVREGETGRGEPVSAGVAAPPDPHAGPGRRHVELQTGADPAAAAVPLAMAAQQDLDGSGPGRRPRTGATGEVGAEITVEEAEDPLGETIPGDDVVAALETVGVPAAPERDPDVGPSSFMIDTGVRFHRGRGLAVGDRGGVVGRRDGEQPNPAWQAAHDVGEGRYVADVPWPWWRRLDEHEGVAHQGGADRVDALLPRPLGAAHRQRRGRRSDTGHRASCPCGICDLRQREQRHERSTAAPLSTRRPSRSGGSGRSDDHEDAYRSLLGETATGHLGGAATCPATVPAAAPLPAATSLLRLPVRGRPPGWAPAHWSTASA